MYPLFRSNISASRALGVANSSGFRAHCRSGTVPKSIGRKTDTRVCSHVVAMLVGIGKVCRGDCTARSTLHYSDNRFLYRLSGTETCHK